MTNNEIAERITDFHADLEEQDEVTWAGNRFLINQQVVISFQLRHQVKHIINEALCRRDFYDTVAQNARFMLGVLENEKD